MQRAKYGHPHSTTCYLRSPTHELCVRGSVTRLQCVLDGYNHHNVSNIAKSYNGWYDLITCILLYKMVNENLNSSHLNTFVTILCITQL